MTSILRLNSLMYLPMTEDGMRLTEPTEIRARVNRIGASPHPVVTVAPHMEGSHRVTLFRDFVPSRKVPDVVQATVDAFNADIDAGWARLLTEFADREFDAAHQRLLAAEADREKWLRFRHGR